jgi:hypothetical protein
MLSLGKEWVHEVAHFQTYRFYKRHLFNAGVQLESYHHNHLRWRQRSP